MGFCKCGDGQQNLGVLGCYDAFQSVKKHIRVNTFDSQGNRNSILLADLVEGKLTDAYILDKLNEDDYSKRWFLTPKKYENVEPSRTDSTYEDFSSGTRILIDTGVKAFQGVIPLLSGNNAAKQNSGTCTSSGNYEIDTSSSIKGEMSIDGLELYPIQMASGSFEAVEIDPVEGSSVQRVQVTFQYDKTVNEGQLRIINGSDIDVDLLKVNGAVDGLLSETGVTTSTTFSSTFVVPSPDTFGGVIPIEGQLEPTDWLIVDSGLIDIPISNVTETIAGQYDFTITSTPSETLSVSFVGVPDSSLDQVYESDVLLVTTPV